MAVRKLTSPSGPAPHPKTLFPVCWQAWIPQWLNQGPFLKGDIVRKLVAEISLVLVELTEVPIIGQYGTEEDGW